MTEKTIMDFPDDVYESLFKEASKSSDELMQKVQDAQLRLIEVRDSEAKRYFDDALNRLHYARACRRVGRCMRLAVMMDDMWAGGIVLGSPFPNVCARDEALGLREFITSYTARNLRNPWSQENIPYWRALQAIVNHARAFVFPRYQGVGLGTKSQSLLLSQGVGLWEGRYDSRVYALDNLCDRGDSKLFLYNGWTLVGHTKGFTSASRVVFSRRVKEGKTLGVRNNAGLVGGSKQWEVWIKVIDASVLEHIRSEYGFSRNLREDQGAS